jgi:hypothetical protein
MRIPLFPAQKLDVSFFSNTAGGAVNSLQLHFTDTRERRRDPTQHKILVNMRDTYSKS